MGKQTNPLAPLNRVSPELAAQVMISMGGMHCDFPLCKTPPTVAPRLYVPCKWEMAGNGRLRYLPFDHVEVNVFDLHYCEKHIGHLTCDDILNAKNIKARVERFAKSNRPGEWVADFESAHIDYVDIYDQLYVKWLASKLSNGRAI